MFFVRAAFWILLVVLLMPSNSQEKLAFYGTAERTIQDIGGFCTRNPDVCDNTTSIFQAIVHKIGTTAEMLEDMIRQAGLEKDPTVIDEQEYREREGAALEDRNMSTASVTNDTLTPIDRNPTWRGPQR